MVWVPLTQQHKRLHRLQKQYCKQLEKIPCQPESQSKLYFLPKAGVAAIMAPGTVPKVNPAAEKHAEI